MSGREQPVQIDLRGGLLPGFSVPDNPWRNALGEESPRNEASPLLALAWEEESE